MALTASDILNKSATVSSETKAIKRLYFCSGGFCELNGVPDGCISFADLNISQKKVSTERSVDTDCSQLSLETPVKHQRLQNTYASISPAELTTPSQKKVSIERLADSNGLLCETSAKRQRIPDVVSCSPLVDVASSQKKTPIKRLVDEAYDRLSPETPVKRQRLQDTEANLSYTWKGLELGKLNKGRSVGLNNTRNDCFINSVLQFVFHTPQLIRYLQSRRNHKCNLDKNQCIYCILNVYIERVCKHISTAFTPGNLRYFVNTYFPNRIPNNQEDAHEMLLFLLSKLEPPLPKRTQVPTPRPAQLTEIDRIFGGKLCNQILCKSCKHRQLNKEEVRELNLNLNETQSFGMSNRQPLQRYIETYFKVEHLEDYKCDKCKNKGSTRQLCIENGPQILIIQLKRFRHNGSKNSIEIEIPQSLDMSRFTFKSNTSLHYTLYGFISHCGMTPNSGHYKATMRGYDSQSWFVYDDEDVTPTNPGRFDSRQPYLLFYYKDFPQPHKNGNFKNGSFKTSSTQSFMLNGNTNQQKQTNGTNGVAVKRQLGQPPSSSIPTNGNYFSTFSNKSNGFSNHNTSNGSSSTNSPLKRPFSAETSNTNGYHNSQNGSNGKSSYHSQENGMNGKNKENNDEYRSHHHHYNNGHSHSHHHHHHNKNRSHSFDNYSRYHSERN